MELIESPALPYLLEVPRERTPGPLPLLCFLHGYDEAAPTPIEKALTRHGPLSPAGLYAAAGRFIVMAPQLPLGGDLWHRFVREVFALVDEVQTGYDGDPRRTCLTGFSFGGNGVFDLALTNPGFWAALWAVDPTRVPVDDPQSPVWISSGEVARRSRQGFIERLGLRPPADVEKGDRVWEDHGEDHVGSARRAYADERIYGWLARQRRAA